MREASRERDREWGREGWRVRKTQLFAWLGQMIYSVFLCILLVFFFFCFLLSWRRLTSPCHVCDTHFSQPAPGLLPVAPGCFRLPASLACSCACSCAGCLLSIPLRVPAWLGMFLCSCLFLYPFPCMFLYSFTSYSTAWLCLRLTACCIQASAWLMSCPCHSDSVSLSRTRSLSWNWSRSWSCFCSWLSAFFRLYKNAVKGATSLSLPRR